jgi:hypothetical protein
VHVNFQIMDRGFFLTLSAMRRQLAAMPCDFYLVRLIHHHSKKPLPADVWTAPQLTYGPTVRFLRARNHQGYDVYFQPCAFQQNPGYIFVDLDQANPAVLDAMRANGHQPCVMIQTSPGHLQAWVRVSVQPLAPALATEIGRQLAHLYQGDRASTDWRHLGRLAGFTNQKPIRRMPTGWPPWVKLLHASVGFASNANSLIQAASHRIALASEVCPPIPVLPSTSPAACLASGPLHQPLTAEHAATIYQTLLHCLRIPQRFTHPDWSIADLWIATELLLRGTPALEVKTILRLASPQFPRRHANPEDYLQRTLTCAVRRATFPARHGAAPPFRIHPSS